MSTRPPSTPSDEPIPARRIDSVFAITSLVLIGLSVVCFFAILIGSAVGVDFNTGVWPTLGVVVYVAPIVGFVLLLTVLIRGFMRRGRASRAGGGPARRTS